MSPVDTYGLKSWASDVSGELSITSAGALELADPPDPLDDALGFDELDEHAATAAASRLAAASAMNRLWFGNLLFILRFFLSGFS
jgi:hypothetical protein